jgi:hypothetical protein
LTGRPSFPPLELISPGGFGRKPRSLSSISFPFKVSSDTLTSNSRNHDSTLRTAFKVSSFVSCGIFSPLRFTDQLPSTVALAKREASVQVQASAASTIEVELRGLMSFFPVCLFAPHLVNLTAEDGLYPA